MRILVGTQRSGAGTLTATAAARWAPDLRRYSQFGADFVGVAAPRRSRTRRRRRRTYRRRPAHRISARLGPAAALALAASRHAPPPRARVLGGAAACRWPARREGRGAPGSAAADLRSRVEDRLERRRNSGVVGAALLLPPPASSRRPTSSRPRGGAACALSGRRRRATAARVAARTEHLAGVRRRCDPSERERERVGVDASAVAVADPRSFSRACAARASPRNREVLD